MRVTVLSIVFFYCVIIYIYIYIVLFQYFWSFEFSNFFFKILLNIFWPFESFSILTFGFIFSIIWNCLEDFNEYPWIIIFEGNPSLSYIFIPNFFFLYFCFNFPCLRLFCFSYFYFHSVCTCCVCSLILSLTVCVWICAIVSWYLCKIYKD